MVLIAVVDVDTAALQRASSMFPGVPTFDSVTDALANSSAEAWVCAVAIGQRVEVCKQLLIARKPVLCEQPLSDELSAAESLDLYTDDDGAPGTKTAPVFMMSHPQLFDPHFRSLRHSAIRRGALSYIACEHHLPAATLDPTHSHVCDDGTHGLSIFDVNAAEWVTKLRALVGGAEPAVFRASSFSGHDAHYGIEHGQEHLLHAELLWDSGLVAHLSCARVLPDGEPPRSRLHVCGRGWHSRIAEADRSWAGQPLLITTDNTNALLPADPGRNPPPAASPDDLGPGCGPLVEMLRTFVRSARAPINSSLCRSPDGLRLTDGIAAARWLWQLKRAAANAQHALPLAILAPGAFITSASAVSKSWREIVTAAGAGPVDYSHPVHAAPPNRALPVRVLTADGRSTGSSGGSSGPTLVILAGLGGDEAAGMAAVRHVMDEAGKPPAQGGLARGRVVAVLCCNLDAWNIGRGSVTGPSDGQRLDRCFPGRHDGTLAERVAYTITQDFLRFADFVAVLHTGGDGSDFQIAPLAGYAAAGPPDAALSAATVSPKSRSSAYCTVAAAAATACGLSAVWAASVAEGSALTAAAAHGVPGIFIAAAGTLGVMDHLVLSNGIYIHNQQPHFVCRA